MRSGILAVLVIAVVIGIVAATAGAGKSVFTTGEWEGYDREWQIVDSLERQGLPQSAETVVQEILKHAETEKNDPQMIRAMLYVSKYAVQTRENGDIEAIKLFEEKIRAASSPTKNILQSMLAGMYWNYYSNNRWRISQRTETVGYKNDDISTWDVKTLHRKSAELYTASISDRKILKQTPLDNYKEILLSGDDYGKKLRTTVFDLLAFNAIQFFANDEVYITEPEYNFEIKDPMVFAETKAFAGFMFDGSDTASKKLIALHLYQELTLLHITDANPVALIDIDLSRLNFARENAVVANKDSLYLNALTKSEKQYLSDSSATRISYAIANYHRELAGKYDPFDPDQKFKWEYKTALEYCDAAIKRFPNSFGAKQCASLKTAINEKNFNVTTEIINSPEKPFISLVAYRNINNIYLRLVKVSYEELQELRPLAYEERLTRMTSLPVYKSWEQKLPYDGDHHEHKVDIKIDGLPLGSYLLVASAEQNFSISDNSISVEEVWISNISYVNVSENNYFESNSSIQEFFVVNRNTGEPLEGAIIQTFQKEYDYDTRKYVYNKGKSYTTDKSGYFSVSDPTVKDYRYFSFSIKYGNDFLNIDNSYYISKSNKRTDRNFVNTYFFTDRAIYRPGQTIYFKGVMVESSPDGKTKSVVTKEKTTVTFFDVNSQKIASLDLTTNEYGSFSGVFTAPAGTLTGQMRIQNESGSEYFSIEEYKRPTFSVEFQPVTGSYVLHDSIKISGTATSYAAASIDNAMVSYRVVRNAHFPYWYEYGWWSRPYPDVPAKEIAHGKTKTDGLGNFSVTFKAEPDETLDRKLKPQFSYTVYADVTDISGETRSGQSFLSVGYTSLIIYDNIPASITTDSATTITITTTNLNETNEPASGKLNIYPLDAPDQLYRDRLLQKADQYIFTEEEYHKLFPKDIYKDENDFHTWKVLTSVTELNWNTNITDSIKIDPTKWSTGKYKIVITAKDKSGEEINVTKYVDVIDGKIIAPPVPSYIYTPRSDFSVQPGEKVNFDIASSAENVHALIHINKQENKSRVWKELVEEMNRGKNKASSATIEVNVNESDRGGFDGVIWFVKDGRYFSQHYYVYVPWNNKDLKVELETHRDKIQPGSNETWKIKISGPQGEKVAAEVLASLYDASLDAFRDHYWSFISWPGMAGYINYNAEGFGLAQGFTWRDDDWNPRSESYYFSYPELNWFGFSMGYYRRYDYLYDKSGGDVDNLIGETKLETVTITMNGAAKADADQSFKEEEKSEQSLEPVLPENAINVPVRSNLNETAFFYPQLQTDEEGNVIFSFTMPEALTTWKFKALAHTKDLISKQVFSSVITQKELMIQPNAPRFLRAGDEIEFTAKISNLTENNLSGTAQLELFNALTMQPVDVSFNNVNKQTSFNATGKGSAAVSWKIKIPEGIDMITYRVSAKSGSFTDGEENALLVLTNKILVTESLPLWVRGNDNKTFNFTKLINSQQSSTLRHQSVTLEYTSNPAWYAVQSLPYMMEYPYECAEQVFNRYYSNSIALHIANSNPEIKRIFESWKKDPDALMSNLQKNEELKSLILEETPWVLQAQDETERKKRIAVLFDVNRMNNEMKAAINKLQKLQLPNGGWPWFKGYEDDRYITQYIVTGMAHLQQLGVLNDGDKELRIMLDKAVDYCDARMLEDYRKMIDDSTDLKDYAPSNLTVHYLYGRSYFSPVSDPETTKARDYYLQQLKKFWTNYSLYEKGMIALTLNRAEEKSTALSITKSLKEFSINSEELGMYWKDNVAGYYWNQAPVETQSLMVEVFGEVANDTKAVEDLKVWLLRQKQTNDWRTTKATAEACYALLLRGTDLLQNNELAIITVGKLVVKPESTEAGTGYFKTNWTGEKINADLGKIIVDPPQANELSYGAMYWQYFEDADKVTAAETQLKLNKKLFIQENSATGPVLKPIDEKTELHVGDLVKVRIELRVDRDMEYVHMKDMRASGFEPINVLSSYKWQDGLGYYEATGDAATNFFFSKLYKGTYVFEYPVRVTHKGNFSNGITTIQCMYAPEFTSHSEGIRVTVK